MWMTIAALLIICLATSTRAGRAEASKAIKRHEWKFNLATAIILAIFAVSIWMGPAD